MRKAGQRPFVSAMARLRGILQIKTSSGAETSAFIERVADISQHMAALALEQEKAVSILNNSSNLIR